MGKYISTTTDEPNKLHQTVFITLSYQPLIGSLILDTDNGPVMLAINRTVAENMQRELEVFLSAENLTQAV